MNGNTQENNDYIEIDILQLLSAMWKKAWLIIVLAILIGAMGFSYAHFLLTPMYTSSALLYVNNNSISFGSQSLSISTSDLSAASKLVNTYIVILGSRMTLEEVISSAHLDLTYEQLSKMVSAEQVNSTEVFKITVKCSDPYLAEKIANTIVKVLPVKIADVVEGSNVKVVDYAVVNTKKVSPSITKYTALGIILGVVLACLYILIEMLLDDVIHDEAALTQAFGIPVLASIPDLKAKDRESYNYYTYGTKKTKGEA